MPSIAPPPLPVNVPPPLPPAATCNQARVVNRRSQFPLVLCLLLPAGFIAFLGFVVFISIKGTNAKFESNRQEILQGIKAKIQSGDHDEAVHDFSEYRTVKDDEFQALLSIADDGAEKALELKKAEASKNRIIKQLEQQQKFEDFKAWAINHTAVTDIVINSNVSIFVSLTANKYTNRDNVRVIAEKLAYAFCSQTGSKYAICEVYYGNEVYAKGSHSAF